MKNVIFLFFLLFSCGPSKDVIKVRYILEDDAKFILDIPKGYIIRDVLVTVERERRFIYPDSSFIYITNYRYTPNHYNIEELGDSIFQERFQDREMVIEINKLLKENRLKVASDSMALAGVGTDSLFWRDMNFGKVSVGYINVTKEKKDLFDKALNTLKINR